ncbi:MAG: glycosyltransferase [Magnetospiraceae bacterium]
MKITFLEDSFAYDADTPAQRPMGGFEKGVVGLACALAERGHTITVVNKREDQRESGGVQWLPWSAYQPGETDVVVALRKPVLLAEAGSPNRSLLWVGAHAGYLSKPDTQSLLDRYDPTLLFLGNAHFDTWKPWKKFRASIIAPGINAAFQGAGDVAPAARAPRAIITTHPLRGLGGLLDAWQEDIHPEAANATLCIYSAALAKGLRGDPASEKLQPLLDRLKGLDAEGIVVLPPGNDREMAEAYQNAALHLYPRIEKEVYCATLAESQACGLPAVAMTTPATSERVQNGQTGFLVHNRATLASTTLRILTDEATRIRLARDAEMLQGGRSWARAALEFETLCS